MRTVNRPQMLQRAMTMCAVVAATASSSVLAFQPGSCSSAASTFAARPHVALRRPAAVQAPRGSRVWAPACARKKAALMRWVPGLLYLELARVPVHARFLPAFLANRPPDQPPPGRFLSQVLNMLHSLTCPMPFHCLAPLGRVCACSLSMVEDFKALVEAAEPDATIVLKAGTYVITDKLLIEKVRACHCRRCYAVRSSVP